MPRQALELAEEFSNYLKTLNSTRLKMENLLATKVVGDDDIEQVYCGLYLSIFTAFQGLIENLFLGLLSGEIVLPSGKGNPKFKPECGDVARNILFVENNFLDWLPYELTIKRAKVLFHNGEPFTLLEPQRERNLEQFQYVRNVIAHKSTYSLRKFKDHVIGDSALTPREKTPVGFLRSKMRTTFQVEMAQAASKVILQENTKRKNLTKNKLYQTLPNYFDNEELKTLCYDLGVDYNGLPGQDKIKKSNSLVLEFESADRIFELFEFAHQQRPDIPWGDIPELLPEITPISQSQMQYEIVVQELNGIASVLCK